MTLTAEYQTAEIEIPQYHIMTDLEGGFLALVVSCSGTMSQHFLCLGPDYKRTAGQFREMIMRAGAELASKQSGLIVVKDLPDGLRKKEGRQ